MSTNRDNKRKPAEQTHRPAAPHDAERRSTPGGSVRWVVVLGLLAVGFFGSFAYAQASRGTASASTQQVAVGSSGRPVSGGQAVGDTIVPSQGAAGGTTAAGTAAGGNCCGGAVGAAGAAGAGNCCGGGRSAASSSVTKGSTTLSGGVQKVTVDLTQGSYTPNQISAKAGVPIELVFKGPASGCNGYVQSQDLGFSQDVSNGGTIKVGALKPGTYSWACSMNMYHASIVVK